MTYTRLRNAEYYNYTECLFRRDSLIVRFFAEFLFRWRRIGFSKTKRVAIWGGLGKYYLRAEEETTTLYIG